MKLTLLCLVLLIKLRNSHQLVCNQVQCLQGIDPFKCPEKTVYASDAALGGCCPGCIRYREPGESCEGQTEPQRIDIKKYFSQKFHYSTGFAPIVESKNCAPGLKCNAAICSDCDLGDPNEN